MTLGIDRVVAKHGSSNTFIADSVALNLAHCLPASHILPGNFRAILQR